MMPAGHYPRSRKSAEEFYERYAVRSTETDCILWAGSLDQYGYARIWNTDEGKHIKAARWVLSKKLGRPLNPGMLACHTCDVPACVNPDHLYEGTYKSNADDKYKRGMGNRGERQGRAKLTNEQVMAIRKDSRKGVVLATVYGVSQMTISRTRAGKTWRHLL